MRLWSLSPEYLDRQGLLAVWREGLLGQSVLLKGEFIECKICGGEAKGFRDTSKEMWKDICPKCKGTGKIKTPWYNHSQLERFKQTKINFAPSVVDDGIVFLMVGGYLYFIWEEAFKRGYSFDKRKIEQAFFFFEPKLTVTQGQLEYEFYLLQKRLWKRDRKKYYKNFKNYYLKNKKIEPHSLFKVIPGEVEKWEKIKNF